MPDEIVNPLDYPVKAAQQLVIELIRANKIDTVSDNLDNLMKVFDQAVKHYQSLSESLRES